MASSTGTARLSEVVSGLFTEPLHAFNQAQAGMVDQWIALLKSLKEANAPDVFPQALAMAPKWAAHIRGDVSMVMRFTKLERRDAGLSVGVSVGPFQAAGSFGFMSEMASESVIQARAAYVVSNDAGETGLVDLLKSLGLPDPLEPASVDDAIARLEALKRTLPASS